MNLSGPWWMFYFTGWAMVVRCRLLLDTRPFRMVIMWDARSRGMDGVHGGRVGLTTGGMARRIEVILM